MKKILIIRRDNIGDLVLTTPFIYALKKKFPDASIDIFTNSYCAPVLANNPDVDNIFVYEKAHHRGARSVISVYWERCRLLWSLRRNKYDTIILGKPNAEIRPLRVAQVIGAPMTVGITERSSKFVGKLTHPVFWHEKIGLHVAERCMQLLEPFGAEERAGSLRLFPDPNQKLAARKKLEDRFPTGSSIIAVQISARKLKQRWPLKRYAALMKKLHDHYGFSFALFWSPGSAENPMHPGDDENASALTELLGKDFPCLPFPTHTLGELIATLPLMTAMITSDGGALHLGAASGLPTLAFFGNSEASRWHPWQVPFELLQPASNDVQDISVDDAFSAFRRLVANISPEIDTRAAGSCKALAGK